jgi:hypothetical protein
MQKKLGRQYCLALLTLIVINSVLLLICAEARFSDYLFYLLSFSVNAISLFLATRGEKPFLLRIFLVLVPSLLLTFLGVFIAVIFIFILMGL